ncbi:AfsR/SARP family transcriptional regulator, partial [Dactylosporangium salmoneum]
MYPPLVIRLLGAVEARVDGQPAGIGHPRQRAVLAVLAVDAGSPVTVEDLIDRVWDEPPDRVRQSVYVYVARLRHVMPIAKRSRAYLLDVDPDAVDLHRFRRLAATDPRAALDLWQGRPLADVEGSWAAAQRARWAEERRDATVAWADAELLAGRAAGVIGPLGDTVADHPRAEPPVERLMRALRDERRYAEALHVYADLRERLADALGADPGPSLQALHRSLLRGEEPDPAAVRPRPAPTFTVPAQMPLDVRGFAGRGAAIAELDALAATTERGSVAVVISALSGTAGVGKTALAVHWAHRAAHRFPDGQLYVNLRGFGPPGAGFGAGEALRVLLDGLGVPADRVPSGLDAQAALYRSAIAGRRMIVVLDNARDAAHVRPLLPGAPGCLVVITSRDSLGGLVAGEGAVPLPLDLLDRQEARDLLAGRLGAQRVAREPDAVEEIIDRCARLPLALAIAAARAAVDPRRALADVARELAGAEQQLDPFAGADVVTDARAVFSWSYRMLRPPLARMFRLLGLQPGDDVGAPVAASLAGVTPERAARMLAELADAHLATEARPGRYGQHDLLRAFARELAAGDPEAPAAVRRLADHYLHTSATLAGRLDPFRVTVPLPPPAHGVRAETLEGGGAEEALGWFAAEYSALMAIVRTTAGSDDPGLAVHPARLARNLVEYQQRTGRWSDLLAAHETAARAAHRHADRLGEAVAQHGIARANAFLGDVDAAATAGLRAADLYRDAGLPVAEADARRSVAVAYSRANRLPEALEHARRLVELYERHGEPSDRAQGLNTLGYTLVQLGRADEALDPLTRALELQRGTGDEHGAAFTLDSLGLACARLGRPDEAAGHYRRSLELFERAGDRYGQVYPLCGLGDVVAALGDRSGARELYERALLINREVDGDPLTTDL